MLALSQPSDLVRDIPRPFHDVVSTIDTWIEEEEARRRTIKAVAFEKDWKEWRKAA